MSKTYKRGDHVEWNSEAGRVRGVIERKVVSDIRFKGYVHHASKDELSTSSRVTRPTRLRFTRGER